MFLKNISRNVRPFDCCGSNSSSPVFSVWSCNILPGFSAGSHLTSSEMAGDVWKHIQKGRMFHIPTKRYHPLPPSISTSHSQDICGQSVVECGVWTPINGGVGGVWRLTGSTANAIESQHNRHHAWPGPTESLPDGTDCGVPPIFDDSFIISCAVRATWHPSAASERAEQRREPAWGHAGSQIAGHIAEAPRGACTKCMGFDPRQPRRVLDPSSPM